MANQELQELYESWHCSYPNTADWNFDFYKLLEDREPIGKFTENNSPKVAIVGAGIAGLLAARELIKAGCKKLHIYEASERIGGRTYSIKVKAQKKTTYELGAMRIPFFFIDEEQKKHNSVLGHLTELFEIEYRNFPAPGSDKCYTGVFINDGFGPDNEFDKPTLIKWRKGEKIEPSNVKRTNLWKVMNQWDAFASTFKNFAESKYSYNGKWKTYWELIVKNYHDKDFRQLVFMKCKVKDFSTVEHERIRANILSK